MKPRMIPNTDRPRPAGRTALLVVAMAIMLAASHDVAAQADATVGRYTTVAAQPAAGEDDPLGVVARVHFPRTAVATVGDALRHLLARTGYALAPTPSLSPAAQRLMALPLPESHRDLGPYRVDAMLAVLLGKPWSVHVDRTQRQVAFGLDGEGAPGRRVAEASND